MMISVRLLVFPNACSPISVTLSGKFMEIIPLALKAYSPMLVTPLGTVTEVTSFFPMNTCPPMAVMPAFPGIFTSALFPLYPSRTPFKMTKSPSTTWMTRFSFVLPNCLPFT